jgi:hypothetical protein
MINRGVTKHLKASTQVKTPDRELKEILANKIAHELDNTVLISILEAAGVDVVHSGMEQSALTSWLEANCKGTYSQYGRCVVFDDSEDKMFFLLQKSC